MPETMVELAQMMQAAGVNRLYAKKLAPNDNSKNQVYLGGDFTALNILPHGSVYTDTDETSGSVRNRAKAVIDFYWLGDNGNVQHAPSAQLILYPNYPEVRLSGFLKNCRSAPSDIMRVREEGRVMFFGITNDGKIISHAAGQNSNLAKAIHAQDQLDETGVFLRIPLNTDEIDTREQLLTVLRKIHQMYWVASQKLGKDAMSHSYAARNGGGYTLEALLGISPNGYSEPDYLGWEIKQYGVRDFVNFSPKSPVTLMTPEPTAGEYQDLGVEFFLKNYGYPDRSGKPDRLNFGGKYVCGYDAHHLTGVRLDLEGYDFKAGKISDMGGGLVLLTKQDIVAAKWGFGGMLEHWNRKHAKAAYVPSLFRKPPPEYSFSSKILLCEQTDFSMFLAAVVGGSVYYDPGIKIENVSSDKPKIKKRSQFRVAHKNLPELYKNSDFTSLF